MTDTLTGRDLDAAVAELMGWEKVTVGYFGVHDWEGEDAEWNETPWQVANAEWLDLPEILAVTGNSIGHYFVNVEQRFIRSVDGWSPSTSIAHAWEVVEKLTSTTKQWFRLEQHSTGCEATFEIIGAGDADRSDSAEAETAEIAICLAALAAVRATR